VHDLKERRI